MFSFLGNPPFVTFVVFAICCFNLLFSPPLASVCLLPALTFPRWQLYRILTFPFYHAGIFHLLFNMLAWMTMAKDLENTIGSFALLYTVFVLFIPFSAALEAMAAVLLDAVLPTHYWRECSVGISGVLFSMLVVQLHLSGDDSASFFGLFDIPIHLFPWILAAFLQLISPGLSLLGHLSGIVVGYALALGYFRRLTPSDHKLEQWENSLRLTRLPSWQPVPSMFAGMLSYLSALPVAANGPPSLTDRVRSLWRRITNAFSGMSGGSSADRYSDIPSANYSSTRSTPQWTGVGRTLGTADDPPAPSVPSVPRPVAQPQTLGTPGRIPANSRLLREASAGGGSAPATAAVPADSEVNGQQSLP